MKKFLSLSAVLLAAALVFMGCKQPVAEDTDPFSDCSETVSTIEMSDGTWTITTSNSGTSNGMSYTSDFTFKATVADGELEITSGTQKMVMKTEDVLGEYYSTYTSLTAEQKKQFQEVYKSGLTDSFEASFGTVEDVTMTDEYITITLELGSAMLQSAAYMFNPANLPEGSTIKTNSDKTKYIITVTIQDHTAVYYATKD